MGVQNNNSTRAELEAYKKKTQAETLRALEEAVAETKPASSRVAPSILPTDDREKSTFSTIRQGTATNALTKVKASTPKSVCKLRKLFFLYMLHKYLDQIY